MQIFVMNMTFISSREVKILYILFVANIYFFQFTRWIKSHIRDKKKMNILYLLLYIKNVAHYLI